jgi:hypothetical protein
MMTNLVLEDILEQLESQFCLPECHLDYLRPIISSIISATSSADELKAEMQEVRDLL